MKIGIGLPNQVRDLDPTLIPRWAARAEAAGFSTLGTLGRFAYPGVSDLAALAVAAGATQRIGLLSSVLVATTWPATLLAKEVAGIDGMSGGRLTLGISVGERPDDFVVEGLGPRGRGRRLDADLVTYRSLWDGTPVGDSLNPAVPAGTRRVPLLFGAFSEPALRRAAREGDGHITSGTPDQVGSAFAAARAAWREAGRSEPPRLVAIPYFAIGDPEQGREDLLDYYSYYGQDGAAAVAATLNGGPEAIRSILSALRDLGADEVVFTPTVADLGEVSRLADLVL